MAEERATVLVVEDEPDILVLCRVSLAFEGYEVVEARDGEEAMARLRTTPPDVVVLDVMLPRMDGWQVLSAIKSDADLKDLPVVLLTGRAKEQDQYLGWTRGAADHLAKPFSPLALWQVLEDVLGTTPQEEEDRRRLILERLPSLDD